jgi:hypothetical protein
VVPVEQGPPEVKAKRRAHGDVFAASREVDASEVRPRQKARLIALLLMIASSIVVLMLSYEAWKALRAS